MPAIAITRLATRFGWRSPTFRSAADRVAGDATEPASATGGLDARQRAILAFEARAWRDPARKADAIRDLAGMPEVIAYALRHSSIVRDIRKNVPIRIVAAKHDTSVAMIERHYSKWIVDGLEDVLREAIVPLVPPAVRQPASISHMKARPEPLCSPNARIAPLPFEGLRGPTAS